MHAAPTALKTLACIERHTAKPCRPRQRLLANLPFCCCHARYARRSHPSHGRSTQHQRPPRNLAHRSSSTHRPFAVPVLRLHPSPLSACRAVFDLHRTCRRPFCAVSTTALTRPPGAAVSSQCSLRRRAGASMLRTDSALAGRPRPARVPRPLIRRRPGSHRNRSSRAVQPEGL